MKNITYYLMIVPAILALSCASDLEQSPIGPWDPIFPATNSILPMQKNNTWVFSHTEYDSLGERIVPHALDHCFSIAAQYGLVNDTTLVPLDNTNYNTSYPDYAFAYEEEGRGSGHIVVYRKLYPLDVRGLYFIGEYDQTSVRLYPKEQLWLVYPGTIGKTWEFRPVPFADTTLTFSMELLSTHAPSYRLDSGAVTGIAVYDSCYLYKQTNGDTTAYFYYNEAVGNLGFQQYIAGKLRKTLVLKSASFNNRNTPE